MFRQLNSSEYNALSLSNDSLNVLPLFRNDYLDLEALKEAASRLSEAHLRGGRGSLRNVVNTRVRPAIRMAHTRAAGEETALLATERQGNYESIKPPNSTPEKDEEDEDEPMDEDIRNFRERFRFEVLRVDRVYNSELDKLEARFKKLEAFIAKILAAKGKHGLILKRDELTPEFELIFRKAHHIENFALTNYSMAVTVLQLHKVSSRLWSPGFLGERLLREELEPRGFTDATRVRGFLDLIRDSFARVYCDGNKLVAEHRLLRKHRDQIDWHTVVVGAWVGAALMGVLWAVYAAFAQAEMNIELNSRGIMLPEEDKTGGIRIFRATGLILFMFCGFCIQVGIWREARVNFPVIFGISAVFFPPTSTLFLVAARCTVFYLMCLVLYVRTRGTIADVFPLATLVAFVYLVVLAWYTVDFKPRRAADLSKSLSLFSSLRDTAVGMGLFIAGVSEKNFLTAYMADYLTSSTKILADFAHITCNAIYPDDPLNASFVERFRSDSSFCRDSRVVNYVVVPIIMCWPLWLRLGQNLSRLYDTGTNWPFLFNAAKYAMAHTITIFSTLHPDLLDFSSGNGVNITFFVFAFVLTTLVTFLWDVVVDWGLGDFSKRGLRENIMFERAVYYWAIVGDFFLRFLWTLQLIPSFQTIHSFLLTTSVTTAFEVVRRTYWGLLRVENEMINNTRRYSYPSSRKSNGGHQHFIPLYFDSPFQVDLEANEEEEKVPATLTRAMVKTEIALFVLSVGSLAAIAIFYR